MNLSKKGIKTPEELKKAIKVAAKAYAQYQDAIWAIHKYKWYNWYQNLHIKADSPADIENTSIFKDLENNHPLIHKDVEQNIKFEIDKLSNDLYD